MDGIFPFTWLGITTRYLELNFLILCNLPCVSVGGVPTSFDSQTYSTRGEEIIGYNLKFLSRICRYCGRAGTAPAWPTASFIAVCTVL
jgi:hypothetical protein